MGHFFFAKHRLYQLARDVGVSGRLKRNQALTSALEIESGTVEDVYNVSGLRNSTGTSVMMSHRANVGTHRNKRRLNNQKGFLFQPATRLVKNIHYHPGIRIGCAT